MKVLVTGANGFAGRHAVAALQAAGHEVTGGDLACPSHSPVPCVELDVCRPASLSRVLATVHPDAILHLGGIAFVPLGWTEPQRVFSVNTIGTLNLLEAVRQHAPTVRVLVVTSAEVYGSHPAPPPLTEDAPYRPDNIYGIAKATADHSALLYASHHQLAIMVARPSNHIGPGQSLEFVSTAFAVQLAAIADGSPPLLRVGNLEPRRDFTDVRDVVRAYVRLLEAGRPGQAYNIASGRMIPVRDLLDGLCEAAGVRPQIDVDPARFRPNEERPRYDISRIRREVGWQPEIPLRDSLAAVYADIRSRRAAGT